MLGRTQNSRNMIIGQQSLVVRTLLFSFPPFSIGRNKGWLFSLVR